MLVAFGSFDVDAFEMSDLIASDHIIFLQARRFMSRMGSNMHLNPVQQMIVSIYLLLKVPKISKR